MKSLERVSGTLLLCDLVYGDRGKLHLLGAGWSEIGPAVQQLNGVVNVQLPPRPSDSDLAVDIRLFRSSKFADGQAPEAAAQIVGELDESGVPAGMPSLQLLAPWVMQVALRPSEAYTLELVVNGETTAYVTFNTRGYPDD